MLCVSISATSSFRPVIGRHPFLSAEWPSWVSLRVLTASSDPFKTKSKSKFTRNCLSRPRGCKYYNLGIFSNIIRTAINGPGVGQLIPFNKSPGNYFSAIPTTVPKPKAYPVPGCGCGSSMALILMRLFLVPLLAGPACRFFVGTVSCMLTLHTC